MSPTLLSAARLCQHLDHRNHADTAFGSMKADQLPFAEPKERYSEQSQERDAAFAMAGEPRKHTGNRQGAGAHDAGFVFPVEEARSQCHDGSRHFGCRDNPGACQFLVEHDSYGETLSLRNFIKNPLNERVIPVTYHDVRQWEFEVGWHAISPATDLLGTAEPLPRCSSQFMRDRENNPGNQAHLQVAGNPREGVLAIRLPPVRRRRFMRAFEYMTVCISRTEAFRQSS
jgi:hypothetical protein